uniref:Uncharacterized protein n=1 Tax=Romanomermis culicivorax TaxID=13658 RepID=A0A915J5M3_ROMCU
MEQLARQIKVTLGMRAKLKAGLPQGGYNWGMWLEGNGVASITAMLVAAAAMAMVGALLDFYM